VAAVVAAVVWGMFLHLLHQNHLQKSVNQHPMRQPQAIHRRSLHHLQRHLHLNIPKKRKLIGQIIKAMVLVTVLLAMPTDRVEVDVLLATLRFLWQTEH
jgi:DNA-directed RNA polymerase subunit F